MEKFPDSSHWASELDLTDADTSSESSEYIQDTGRVDKAKKEELSAWRPQDPYDIAPEEVLENRFEEYEQVFESYQAEPTEENRLALVRTIMRVIAARPPESPESFTEKYRGSIYGWKNRLALYDEDGYTEEQVNASIRVAMEVISDRNNFAEGDVKEIIFTSILRGVHEQILFGLKQEELQKLEDRFFIGDTVMVKRTSGEIEGGWKITHFIIAKDNKKYAALRKPDRDNGGLEKIIDIKELAAINP
jgi:hypothetical protein